MKCIKKYSKGKEVPKINIPDKYFSKYNPNRNKPSEKKLYPNDKRISLYENGYFVVRQIYNTCYFIAPIPGLIDQETGDYIKEKMGREYEKIQQKQLFVCETKMVFLLISS